MSNHRAKKSLGQNFLTSTNIAREIVGFGELAPGDTVLEIGPGKGVMTQFLLEGSDRVFAVEKDTELFKLLEERFSNEIKNNQLILINDDILNFNIPSYGLKDSGYKLIANIPYNITGAFFKKFLSTTHQPSSITVMIQKEVGERILAKPVKGKSRENILSLSIKAYGAPRIVKNVPKKHFLPQPKVDSVVLHIENISKDLFKDMDEKTFFKAIKSGFSHKRKKLIRNLSQVFPEDTLDAVFKDLSLDDNTRAEMLTMSEWVLLVKKLS